MRSVLRISASYSRVFSALPKQKEKPNAAFLATINSPLRLTPLSTVRENKSFDDMIIFSVSSPELMLSVFSSYYPVMLTAAFSEAMAIA